MKRIILKARKTGNNINMSWWRQCGDALKLSCSGEEGGLVLDGPVDDSTKNAINIAVAGEDNKDNDFVTLNLLQNLYLLRVYYEFLGSIANEVEEKIVDETIFLLAG